MNKRQVSKKISKMLRRSTSCAAETDEMFVDSVPTILIGVLPMGHILNPLPTCGITGVVPITAFSTSCTGTTLTVKFLVGAKCSKL